LDLDFAVATALATPRRTCPVGWLGWLGCCRFLKSAPAEWRGYSGN